MGEELKYKPNSTPDMYDNGRYDIQGYGRFYADDVAGMSWEDIAPCAQSPLWEDRVRAAYLMHHLEVVLPDGFPCIYEVDDSPNLNRTWSDGSKMRLQPRWDRVWVKHPDVIVLRAALSEYQWMWDQYTNQWGDTARRVFAVDHLNNVQPHGLYRPDSTVDQILQNAHNLHSIPLPERMRELR